MRLHFSPVTEADIREFVFWRYEPPYEIYNALPTDAGESDVANEIDYFLDPDINCFAIHDEHGRLAAFCTFGRDARVSGGDYSAPALDIGLGVKPELTGRGFGHIFIGALIGFAQANFKTGQLRVTIAAFNTRAQRVWKNAGFKPRQHFRASTGSRMPFIIFTRPAMDSAGLQVEERR